MVTEAELKALKPRDKPYKVYVADGLYELVMPGGSVLHRFKYKWEGREKGYSLGSFPEVSLARACELRDEANKLIANGIDPGAARQTKKLALGDSFKVIAEEWIAHQAKTLSANTIDIYRARLTNTLLPAFGSWPFTSIKAPHLLKVLRGVERNGTFETAHRLRALFGRIADHAIATGRAEPEQNITRALKRALTPVKVKHFAAIIEPKRIGELLRAIDGYFGMPSVGCALKLAALTFVRPGELRGALWSEIDFEAAEWRIPGERMKMDRPHIVPLSRQALKVLRELHALTDDGALLFPGLRAPTRQISDNTINAALRGMGFAKGQMTCHGFRTMASTTLNELGENSDLIELQLAHTEGNKTRGAYNRAQRLPERRKMMQRWADHLDKLRGHDGPRSARTPSTLAASAV